MEYFYLILRVLCVFLLTMLIIRILGKREIGELSIFDLVVLLMIADLGSIGIDESEKFLLSILCLLILLILQKCFSYLTIKFSKLRNILEGKPRIIIYDGLIDIVAMRKENYTIDDLLTQVRDKKIMDISEVRLAVLETNGTLSVFRKEKYSTSRLPIVLSGNCCDENLKALNLNYNDILIFFKANKIDIKKVIYASYDLKQVFFYLKDNNTKQLPLMILDWHKQD